VGATSAHSGKISGKGCALQRLQEISQPAHFNRRLVPAGWKEHLEYS
jgi:hypothetical protein